MIYLGKFNHGHFGSITASGAHHSPDTMSVYLLNLLGRTGFTLQIYFLNHTGVLAMPGTLGALAHSISVRPSDPLINKSGLCILRTQVYVKFK